jgi:hypothetical protein
MSNRPELCTRQWDLLNALVAQRKVQRKDPTYSPGEVRHADLYNDLRTLAGEGCIAIATANASGVRIAVLVRGERWIDRYRKEQAALVASTISKEEVA